MVDWKRSTILHLFRTMKIRTYTLDAFTDQPFSGNPAVVCQVKEGLADKVMLQIAQEFNVSETAYLINQEGYYDIRYFSPIQEIPLCGHATLASAKMLFSTKQMDKVKFKTVQGLELTCYKKGNEVMMKFPLYDTVSAEASDDMVQALGISQIVDVRLCEKTSMLLVEMADLDELKGMEPDFAALKKSYAGISGVIVTAAGDGAYDFYSRYFWPWSGGNEDPVTGASHTVLAKYWSDKLGKTKLNAFQASSRGGFMSLEVKSPTELEITSTAVVVHTGELLLND